MVRLKLSSIISFFMRLYLLKHFIDDECTMEVVIVINLLNLTPTFNYDSCYTFSCEFCIVGTNATLITSSF